MGPYVHVFFIDDRYYLYDVNTNQIVEIGQKLYHSFLRNDVVNTIEVQALKEKGLLSENRMKHNYNPVNEMLDDILESNLETLLLQVTQNCNLRCEYCMYSGQYEDIRTHGNLAMSEDIMKKAVNYLIRHSSKSPEITVGFYGGEPLVNFELISKTVNYIKMNIANKIVNYTMTTNATLLNPSICQFLVKNNFKLQISIDGEERVHDNNRKYINREGTYEDVIDRLNYIYKMYPNYYFYNVSFNAVIDPRITNFEEEILFFSHNDLFKLIRPKLSSINMVYKNKLEVEEEKIDINVLKKRKMEVLYYYLLFSNQTDHAEFNILHKLYSIDKFAGDLENKFSRIPPYYTHAGICIPGIARLFVNAKGDYFPCEKVNERSDTYRIGSVQSGISKDKVVSLLNIGRLTEEKCKNCWAIRFCTICLARIDMERYNVNNMLKRCEAVRRQAEKMLKSYVVLEYYKKIT